MKRSTKPWKRSSPLKAGKKTKAQHQSIKQAIDAYFKAFGWHDGQTAPCQLSGIDLNRRDAIAHHKIPRSELRKVGIKDLDAPQRLLIIHKNVHLDWLHCGQMGRPRPDARDLLRFLYVEQSLTNAAIGGIVSLPEFYRWELEAFIKRLGQ